MKKDNFINSFLFVLISYFLSIFFSFLNPFFVILIVLLICSINFILCLRFSVIACFAMINNQYTIIGMSINYIGYSSYINYIFAGCVAILFFFIVFSFVYSFVKLYISKNIIYFIVVSLFMFVVNTNHVFKSIQFFVNILSGLLLYSILIESALKNIKKTYCNDFYILRMDFLSLLLLIIILNLVIFTIDIVNDFEYLRFHGEYLAYNRGNGEIVYVKNIPKQYVTAVFNSDFIIRYTGILNDPIRSGYFYLYSFLFLLTIRFNFNIKVIFLFFYFLFFIFCFSKSVLLYLCCFFIFYIAYSKNFFTISFIIFISIIALVLILAFELKSSGVTHAYGLILPFMGKFDFYYFLGHGVHESGNMGRIANEALYDSLSKGAESLIGTYMYGYGLVGIFMLCSLFLSIIKIANNKGCYFVSSIITSSLIISLLQEGHYNIMTIYTCLIVSFYYILYKRLNEN